MHLLALWLSKINILEWIWGSIIFGSKIVHLPLTKIFFTKPIINIVFMFLLPLGFYSCAKFQKKSSKQIQSPVDMLILGLNLPICPNKTFFEKQLSFSCTYWSFWLYKISKKSLEQIKSLKDKEFLGPNLPKELFWNILVNIDGSVD